MLELVTASESELDLLEERMCAVRNGGIEPWLREGVKRGDYKVITILDKGKPVGAFWYWFSSGNRAIIVNCAASFSGCDTTPNFMEAFRRLGKALGAKEVQFQTRRSSLIRKMRRAGWEIDGVCMTKNL